MGKRDGMPIGGALGILNTLLDEVFGSWMARVYQDEYGPTQGREVSGAASRRQPTAGVSRASYRVTMQTRAPAGVAGRRPRTA